MTSSETEGLTSMAAPGQDAMDPSGASPAGMIRLLVVVVGGLIVLQSSQALGNAKLLYLGVAALAFALSLRAVWGIRATAMAVAARGWLIASGVLLVVIGISLPVALAHGTPFAQWLRDASTYGLFAAAPVFALDAASSRGRGRLLALTTAVTALGAVSYAVNWITLRNLAILPFDQLVLPTSSLPTTLFVVATGAAVVDRSRRIAWIVIGGIALATFLVAGTRSALFLLLALPVIGLAAGRPYAARSIVAGAGAAVVAAAFVLVIQATVISPGGQLAPPLDAGPPIATPSPGSSPAPGGTPAPGTSLPPPATPAPTTRPPANPNANLAQRIQEFLTSPQRDGSVRERVTQYGVAWDLFMSSPIVGVGLGHPITWTRIDGTVRTDFTADTPLILPAKLGLPGLVWLVFVAFAWLGFTRRLRQLPKPTIPGLALTGWAAILVALAWNGFSIEDKGFSFALMLLLALGFVEIDRAAS